MPAPLHWRIRKIARDVFKDCVAGTISSVVLIANIISFGALMFPGPLGDGIPIAIWAMLIGSSVAGLWIALRTSLPPLSVGIDSPTGAVLVLLSAITASSVVAAGETPDVAVQTVMLVFTAATVVSGGLLYCIGILRWGSYCRFVPYFVVGGFLAATGWFLVAGGIRMATGFTLSLEPTGQSWTMVSTAKLGAAVTAFGVLLAVRRWSRSALAMPFALLTMWLIGVVVLHSAGLSARQRGWYLPSLGALGAWIPFVAVRTTRLTWPIVIALTPQFIAVAIVALISVVTKVASIEVVRQTSGNLDREFRAHGVGNLVAAPLGGIASALQTGPSILLTQAGGATRMSGVACALVLGVVALSHFDLVGLIPIPIISGLVFYLGYTFFVDALSRPYAQRAWQDLLLAIFIMLVCIEYGFVVGVLVGVVGACVRFALTYARLGTIRRHATRVLFASNVDRSAEAFAYLRESGEAIQLYWLSGYIFFGSSEGLFERIRGDIELRPPRTVAYVVLDFAMVTGADASAIMSLTKLHHFCDRHGITLVYCALSTGTRTMLEQGGFFAADSPHRAFGDLDMGLAWCEDRLIAAQRLDRDTEVAGFESWLSHQLGPSTDVSDLMAYLARKRTEGPEIIYREGEPADTVDLVAAGSLTVHVARGGGELLRVRRITTHAVLGEMGFVRRSVRAATVSSDGPATIFTLTRAAFEQMRRERPDLADAFDDFIMRTLADRMEAANRAAAALAG
ncbi:MAG TPA: SulP family inorganic anion transporter [Casimicrobiaceae bacterium]|nr:SulP family inorganic anion transporter [Casimicrobiaceae bacterium]